MAICRMTCYISNRFAILICIISVSILLRAFNSISMIAYAFFVAVIFSNVQLRISHFLMRYAIYHEAFGLILVLLNFMTNTSQRRKTYPQKRSALCEPVHAYLKL